MSPATSRSVFVFSSDSDLQQFNIPRQICNTNDFFQPLIGSHEHFNWVFSSTGIYSATFQVTGKRFGETTNISSVENTFVFQVQPLPSPTHFLTWARGYWPPGFNPPTTLTNGNPDDDAFDNLHEYAFGLSPTNTDEITNSPMFSLVKANSETYGALAFTRYKPAADLICEPIVTDSLAGGVWQGLTDILSVRDNGNTETMVVRDFIPVSTATNRFFYLRLKLNGP